jgi:hypothetical protein
VLNKTSSLKRQQKLRSRKNIFNASNKKELATKHPFKAGKNHEPLKRKTALA